MVRWHVFVNATIIYRNKKQKTKKTSKQTDKGNKQKLHNFIVNLLLEAVNISNLLLQNGLLLPQNGLVFGFYRYPFVPNKTSKLQI